MHDVLESTGYEYQSDGLQLLVASDGISADGLLACRSENLMIRIVIRIEVAAHG